MLLFVVIVIGSLVLRGVDFEIVMCFMFFVNVGLLLLIFNIFIFVGIMVLICFIDIFIWIWNLLLKRDRFFWFSFVVVWMILVVEFIINELVGMIFWNWNWSFLFFGRVLKVLVMELLVIFVIKVFVLSFFRILNLKVLIVL